MVIFACIRDAFNGQFKTCYVRFQEVFGFIDLALLVNYSSISSGPQKQSVGSTETLRSSKHLWSTFSPREPPAWSHRHMPFGHRAIVFNPLFNARVARIAKDTLFLACNN